MGTPAPPPVPEVEAQPPAPHAGGAWHAGIAPWVAGVAAGCAVIGLGALLEGTRDHETPLRDAVIAVHPGAGNGDAAADTDTAWRDAEGAIPLVLLREPNAPEDPFDEARRLVTPRTTVVAIEPDGFDGIRPQLEALLTDGRLPAPGGGEVVAGPGAGEDRVALAGEAFTVVGRLGPDAAIFRHAYLHPGSIPVPERSDLITREGALFPDLDTLEAAVPGETREQLTLTAGAHLAPGGTIALTMLGLLIVALAGSGAWIRLLQNLRGRGGPLLRPAFEACAAHGPLLIGMHAALYAVFFGLMLLSLRLPDTYFVVVAFVQEMFTTGDLQTIGEAYQSGNVLWAKLETWRHNFLFATVLLSTLPSFFVPGAALVKNAASFALLGFGLAPLIEGSARVMTFHAITMWIELEAYILVSFASVLLPVRVLRALANGDDAARAYRDGAIALVSMTVLAGIILLVGALYEAVTLINLR